MKTKMTENNRWQEIYRLAKWTWSRLLRTKDWWAVWTGFILLAIGTAIYFPQAGDIREKLEQIEAQYAAQAHRTTAFKTIAFYQMSDAKDQTRAKDNASGRWLTKLSRKPKEWAGNPLDAFYMSKERAAVKQQKALKEYEKFKKIEVMAFEKATAAENAAEDAGFRNKTLNGQAVAAITNWRNIHLKASVLKDETKMEGYNEIGYLVLLSVIFALLFGLGIVFMGRSFGDFFKGFGFIFVLAVIAFLFAGEENVKYYGIGYAPCAIFLGLLISNTIGTPEWAKPAVQTEYYIKTGLVLLGANILIEKIIVIGTPGVFVAWVVTPIVWLTSYWFGQKVLKITSKRLTATICSYMSVCGVSAAIATAEACRAKDEELVLTVGMAQIFTSIMSFALPLFIIVFFPLDKQMVLGGAWVGGTVDSTGSVAAAGAVLGEKALYVAATVKMVQNLMIGIISFFVALYFTTRVESVETGQKVGVSEIWYRFPKFVFGFMATSFFFSGCYAYFEGQVSGMGNSIVSHGVVEGMSDLLRGWFFCLSFISIGLSVNFRNLRKLFAGGKPLMLYLFGQSFNLGLTLLIAYLMFYIIFPGITSAI